MTLYDYLIDTYGYNEPIVSAELSFNGYSRPWLQKEIGKLCADGKLIRFEKGVYYIPTETLLGQSKLDTKKVINKKYIFDGKDVIGYYSGITFMNMLGLSTQVPNVLEIYTNKEPSRAREVPVGSQKVMLRRSRTTVNRDNAATMSLLELMNFTDAQYYDDEKKEIVRDFIRERGITRSAITKYAPVFPDNAMRTLVESEVIYDVAP